MTIIYIYSWWILRSRKITNTSYLHPHVFLTCQQCSLLVGNPPLNQIYFSLYLQISGEITRRSQILHSLRDLDEIKWDRFTYNFTQNPKYGAVLAMDFPKTLTSSFFPNFPHPFTIILASTNRYCIIMYSYILYYVINLKVSTGPPFLYPYQYPLQSHKMVGTPSFPWANYNYIHSPIRNELSPDPNHPLW